MARSIEEIAETLNITPEKAQRLLEEDAFINGGGRCDWEVSVEEELEMKKMNKLEFNKPHGKKSNRTPNWDKLRIMEEIIQGVSQLTSEIEVDNEEKQISFSFNGSKYSIVLTKRQA